jgi:hypothetical protein
VVVDGGEGSISERMRRFMRGGARLLSGVGGTEVAEVESESRRSLRGCQAEARESCNRMQGNGGVASEVSIGGSGSIGWMDALRGGGGGVGLAAKAWMLIRAETMAMAMWRARLKFSLYVDNDTTSAMYPSPAPHRARLERARAAVRPAIATPGHRTRSLPGHRAPPAVLCLPLVLNVLHEGL